MRSLLFWGLILWGMTAVSHCCAGEFPVDVVAGKLAGGLGMPASVTQVLFVLPTTASATEGQAALLEKTGEIWSIARGPFPCTLGRSGVAAPGEKKEGDGKSPQGAFALQLAFGYEASASTALTYRQALEDDVWVDDPAAPDYNLWKKKSETTAASFEWMRRKDVLYKFGIVVEYNTAPIVKGAGSAIFVHIWPGPGKTTAGCVAFAEEHLLDLLKALNPARHPHIVILPEL